MEYEKSLEIINKCLQYRNDYYIQMLSANNYYHLKRWSNAEKYYLTANCMCPHKFSPLYRLQKLYTIIGKDKEALRLAYILMSKETKIPSINIHYIKNEMQEYIKYHK